jgi:hypothetical protein
MITTVTRVEDLELKVYRDGEIALEITLQSGMGREVFLLSREQLGHLLRHCIAVDVRLRRKVSDG